MNPIILYYLVFAVVGCLVGLLPTQRKSWQISSASRAKGYPHLIEFGKGLFCALIAAPVVTAWFSESLDLPQVIDHHLKLGWVAGAFALTLHFRSPWGLRPGKGIALFLGLLAGLHPEAAVGGFLGFLAAYLRTRSETVSNLSAVLTAVAVYLIFYPSEVYLWAGGIMVFMILLRHEGEINELLQKNSESNT